MPLEIRELQINVSVDAASQSNVPTSTAPAGEGGKPGDELIKECVEQVINTLNQQKER